ncbi:hypothetical protein [Salsipaludibacter albus]|uniref:hypothetical protein n=1 Tax=Salsipaludibacter albus TaxID=2849650 RepID=UPI001EE4E098|nr:hypothetical protein [Salsipaludibacter albus]MBY5161297.1 hypothetical protein [Salsipaludibacter albus]
MADPTPPDGAPGLAALRATVHTHLVPTLVDARRRLDAGDVDAAGDAVDRAHDLARGLLRDPPDDDGVADVHRVLADAAEEARRRHAGRLTVQVGARSGDASVDPPVAAAVVALVDEAAANTAAHRVDGLLELHADTDDTEVTVVARSTGRLHHGEDGSDHRPDATGDGMGLHLLRGQVTDAGGDLQVLHDRAATTLVATLPRPTPDGR